MRGRLFALIVAGASLIGGVTALVLGLSIWVTLMVVLVVALLLIRRRLWWLCRHGWAIFRRYVLSVNYLPEGARGLSPARTVMLCIGVLLLVAIGSVLVALGVWLIVALIWFLVAILTILQVQMSTNAILSLFYLLFAMVELPILLITTLFLRDCLREMA